MKPSKYRNIKTHGYSSRKEAKRAAELKLLERAGKIKDLKEQVRFEIIPKQEGERAAHYVADFEYWEKVNERPALWHLEVEDCKGMKTPAYILKRKLMLYVHGIKVRET